MLMNGMTLKLKGYLFIFYLVGALFVFFSFANAKSEPLAPILSFILLAIITESFPVLLPNQAEISVGFTIWFASLILFGPKYAAIIGFFSAFNYFDLVKDKRAPYKVIFNAFNHALTAGIGGYVFLLFGGHIGRITADQYPKVLIPITLSAVASYILNVLPIVLAINIETGLSTIDIWRRNFLWLIPNYFMLSFVGVALAQSYLAVGPIGIVLIVVPLIVARQTFQVYMKLKNAYFETVQSLVKALEAKDPYTKGHSERVAEYAVKIARQMKFSEDMVEMVLYAALLHDVGKIGISKKILNKKDRLLREEYDLIRRHPEIGAQIIKEVDFLEEPLSAVLYHHEHLDGSGYAYGLKGDEIPKMAKILTVADSFDAMTSARPYRPPLSLDDACQELRRCCGSQFDSETVEALLAALGCEGDREAEETKKEGLDVVKEKV